MIDSWWKRADGTVLRRRVWPAERPKGLLCIVHGYGEHGWRYAPFVEKFLTPAGIEVRTFDQRGQGENGGRRGDLADPTVLTRDIADFVKEEACSRGLPVFVWGHSTGGQLAVNALGPGAQLCGLILSSTWFRLAFEPPGWTRLLLPALLKLAPAWRIRTGLRLDYLSADQEYLRSLPGNELILQQISPRLFDFLKGSGVRALASSKGWESPLLVIHGERDQVTLCSASQEFYAEAASRDKTWRSFPEGRHELQHDGAREEFGAMMTSWILARV